MSKIIIKVILGVVLGILFISFMSQQQSAVDTFQGILLVLWGIGIVYGFRHYLSWMGKTLNSSMQLSVISWMSFGSGLLGFILLVLVLTFILVFGWMYGIYLLIKDIIALF